MQNLSEIDICVQIDQAKVPPRLVCWNQDLVKFQSDILSPEQVLATDQGDSTGTSATQEELVQFGR